jgi:hypothetical protein
VIGTGAIYILNALWVACQMGHCCPEVLAASADVEARLVGSSGIGKQPALLKVGRLAAYLAGVWLPKVAQRIKVMKLEPQGGAPSRLQRVLLGEWKPFASLVRQTRIQSE